MKKFFVIALLVCLVPFAVGCGLWNYDEGNDVAAVASVATNVDLAFTLPATIVGVNADILAQAAGAPYNVFVKVKVAKAVTGWYQLTSYYDAANSRYVYATTTAASLKGSDLDLDANLKLIIKIVNPSNAAKSYLLVLSTVTTSATSAVTKHYMFNIASVTGGVVTFTVLDGVTIAIGSNGAITIVTTGAISTSTTGTSTDANTGYASVSKVEISNGVDSMDLSFDSSNPTIVNLSNLKGVQFRLTFAGAMTTASDTFTVVVDRTDTSASTTISNLTNGIQATYASNVLTASITTDVLVVNGKTYKIILTASSAKDSAGKSLNLPQTAYIKIATTELVGLTGWTTSDSASYETASPTAIELNAHGITAIYSANLEVKASVSYSFLLEKYPTLADAKAGTNLSVATLLSQTTKNVTVSGQTITIKPAAAYTAGSFYRIKYISGTLNDSTGAAVDFMNMPWVIEVL